MDSTRSHEGSLLTDVLSPIPAPTLGREITAAGINIALLATLMIVVGPSVVTYAIVAAGGLFIVGRAVIGARKWNQGNAE